MVCWTAMSFNKNVWYWLSVLLLDRQPCLPSPLLTTTLRHAGEGQSEGFGHIGHLVTRAAFTSGKGDIVIINDRFTDLNYRVCLFQYDSTRGKFKGSVEAKNKKLVITGKYISKFQEWNPTIKWGGAGAEYAVEPTGISTTMEKAEAH